MRRCLVQNLDKRVALFTLASLVLLTHAVTWPAAAQDCPLAGKRPAVDVLRGAPETRPSLCQADLSGTDLRGMNLGRANLRQANLVGANLRGADLNQADLSRADLRRAILRGANLRAANLGEADLGGSDLSGTNLSRADLSQANLGKANLTAADLYESVGLTCAQIRSAYTDASTRLPSGLNCPN